MIYWIRRKHPHLTWKQIRRRFYGADRIIERTDWPYYLRAANIVEITCHAVVYGGVIVLLLCRRAPRHH
jgi:hypothetical protein